MKKKTPPPDLSKLSHEEKDSMILTLLERLDALEARMGKNSHNSSKPPSSDGLAKKTSSLRGKSDKKVGGQKGHKGTTLSQAQHVDETVNHPLPTHCLRCQQPLPDDGAQVLEKRQVFDIPITSCRVTEHRVLECICQSGQSHTSQFPVNVTQTAQYGPNLRALGVQLTQGQLLPFARAAQLIHDLYGVAVSPGTLVLWVAQASAALSEKANWIASQLGTEPLLHADESGVRGDGKLHWLHVVATSDYTWYAIHQKRGMDAIKEQAILPRHKGVLIHDCWQPYWQLECQHALCNAHLLRELTYVKELTKQAWPKKMIDFLLNANKLCEAAREKQFAFKPDDVAAFSTLYEEILREGEALHPAATKTGEKRGRVKQSVAFNLLSRLRQYSKAVLLFISDPTVPFTNNLGERAIRMPKVKQKISGCFRTIDGAYNFTVIRSCLDTFHKQGQSMLEVLRQAFYGETVMLVLVG